MSVRNLCFHIFFVFLLTSLAGCAITGQNQQNETNSDLVHIHKTASNKLPRNQGTVWFPFSLTLQLQSHDEPNLELIIRNPELVVVNSVSKKEHIVPLEAKVAQNSRNALLSSKQLFRTFYSPRLFSLPEGSYNIAFIRYSLRDPERETLVSAQFSLTSTTEENGTEPMEFTARNGEVVAISRTSMRITFTQKKEKITTQTRFEQKDKRFVPTNVVLNNLEMESNMFEAVRAGLNTIPRQRLALETESEKYDFFESPAARVGILFEVPCVFSGVYRLIWKRSGDDREYFVAQTFSESTDKNCSNTQQIPVSVHFPEGKWSLLATQYSKKIVAEEFELPPNVATEADARTYFSLDSGIQSEIWEPHESDIKRKISFEISKRRANKNEQNLNIRKWPLMYAGQIAWSTSVDAEGKTTTISTSWNRRFSLTDLRKLFSTESVFNVYSHTQIERDQTKDQVQSIMRVSSADARKTERSVAEFRRDSTKMFADCIVEREQIDPLISVTGNLKFSVMRASSYVDFSPVTVSSDDKSKGWIEECVEKKLHAFRFSENTGERFSGDIRFVLE